VPRHRPLTEWFWEKVAKGPGCWEWQAARYTNGYGCIDIRRPYRLRTTAHRVAWALTYGPIPAGLFVLHRCDHPTCVRPDHLFLGTHTDNMRDMVAKGRARPRSGESNGLARLTEVAVRAIRANPDGLSARALARQFGMHASTIQQVQHRETWRHVRDAEEGA